MTPRWPSSSGSVCGDRLGGQREHVEGADQVDLDTVAYSAEVVHALLAEDPRGGADAGAVDRPCAAARRPSAGGDRRAADLRRVR